MKIRADRSTLAAAAKTVAPHAGGHQAVTGGVRFDTSETGVDLTCTNIDATVSVYVACEVVEPGSIILPARLFASLLAATSGELVEIDEQDDGATVTSGDTSATLRSLRLDDWPKLPEPDGETAVLSEAQLDLIARVAVYAQADLKAQPMFRVVHFEGSRVEATDNYRMAAADLDGVTFPDLRIPTTVLLAAISAAGEEATIVSGDRWVAIASGDTTWTCRTVEGNYPPLNQFTDLKPPRRLVADREALAAAVKAAAVLVDDRHVVTLSRDGDKLLVRGSTVDVGELVDVVPVSGDFEEAISFDHRFLVAMLANVDDDEVTIELDTGLKPVVARSGDLVQVVMPIRATTK